MLFHDLGLFLLAYFVFLLLQILSLPVIFYVSARFTFIKDAAWGFGRIFSILLLSLVIWHLAFLGLPVNTGFGVWLVFSLLLTFSVVNCGRLFARKKHFLRNFLMQFRKIILVEELVFLFALIFLFVLRGYQPDILGLEKFMDAGFIQAYLKSPTLPAGDMWYATSSINYYSFGHFYNSIFVQLWQVDLSYGYNLLLMTVFAMFCLELFAISFNIRMNFGRENFKAAIVAGILAILLVAFGSNGHTIWYYFNNGGFTNYWYPDATRFIERTIHEFPSYSFVVSDLHAHVLSLPVVLLFMQTLFIWLKEIISFKNLKELKKFYQLSFVHISLIMGALFGILAMTNTWDILIYGLLPVVSSLFILIQNRRIFFPLLISAGAVFTMTIAFCATWYLNFTPISSGLMVAKEHSPLWQLLVMWGPHLFLAILLMFLSRGIWFDRKKWTFLSVFLTSTLLAVIFLIIFPEIFYFKDIYQTYPRANTMFKLVFQAFILLGILLSVLMSGVIFNTDKNLRFFTWRLFDLKKVLPSKRKRVFALKVYLRKVIFLYLPITVFLYYTTLAYPNSAYRSYYRDFKEYHGLNGLQWIEKGSPFDFEVINYLKKNESKQINIVEAVGDSYSEFARISAFSGMPTILGWRVHEWLWRAKWDGPGQRSLEVEKIYNTPTDIESRYYLHQYVVKYIVISEKEKEAYPKLDLEGLLSLGEIVFSDDDNYLIKLY